MTKNNEHEQIFYVFDSHGRLCFYGPDKSTIAQDFANHVGIEWDLLEKEGYTIRTRTEFPPIPNRSKNQKE